VGYFQYLFFYWMHFYFDSILHMEKAESRYFAGLPNLAMAACMPLGGWLADRAGHWRGDPAAATLVPKVGMLLSAALLGCGIFAQDRFWIVVLFTASLGILGLCEATFWTAAVKLGGQRGGTSAAIMNTGGNGIGLLAPMVTPWLGSQLGWEWGLGAGAIVGALGGLCWFAIGRRGGWR
jgi:MFS family permease